MRLHACDRHPEGTPACYRDCRCRCRPCGRAQYRYEALRQLDPRARLVPSIGSRRRIDALMLLGWPEAWLSQRAGWKRDALHAALQRNLVSRSTDARIRRLYDQLWDTPPQPLSAEDRMVTTRARNLAKRRGAAPALAWDDDTIDDPDARPHPARDDTPRQGLSGRPARFDLDDLAFLADAGLNVTQAAERLGVTKSTVEHRCERAERRDLLAQLQRNKEAS